VAFIIYALDNLDDELLILRALGDLHLGSVARDDEFEFLGYTCVVYRLYGVVAAFGQGEGFADAEVTEEVAVLVVYREHCHLVEAVRDAHGYLILEIVHSVEGYGVVASFANHIVDVGSYTDDCEVVLTGVAPIIGYDEEVLSFGFDYGVHENLAVDRRADVIAESYGFCEDILAIGVGEEVLTVCDGSRGFLPVVITLNAYLCVLLPSQTLSWREARR